MSDIVKFKAIFNGLESAYGTYTIESEREDTKQVGKGFVVKRSPYRHYLAKALGW